MHLRPIHLLRSLLALTLALVTTLRPALAATDSPILVIEKTDIPSPADSAFAQVSNPQFAQSPDGTLHLAWQEILPRPSTLRFSRYLPEKRTWSPSSVIPLPASADAAFQSVPAYAFAAGPDRRLAFLHATRDALYFTTSADDGVTWTINTRLDLPAGHTARPSALQFLADNRLLAAWLDTSPAPTDSAAATTALYVRLLDADLKSPAHLIEASVSPGGAPALATFPDGSALLAWRGLSADGSHDIRTARFDDGKWLAPATLNFDNWKPSPPVIPDGPALASRGAHVSCAWFSSAADARLDLATSSTAGHPWFTPSRIDDTAPLGRPSLVMLDDGSNLVSWVEKDKTNESVFLRRLSPRGGPSVPVRLAEAIAGHPRIARVKDGDATPAQLLLAYMQPTPFRGCFEPPYTLVTTLITLPDSSLLAEADLCGCDPRPEDQRGYPFRGRITAIDAKAGTVTITHGVIPGILKAATTTFQADPVLLADLKPGMQLFARTERLGPAWRFFAPRVLVIP